MRTVRHRRKACAENCYALVRLNRAVIRKVAHALLEEGELTCNRVVDAVDESPDTVESRSLLLVRRL